MKRCFYIANQYDGAYFVLTDSIDEYYKRMTAYVINLDRSKKANCYTFGSIELSEKEYEEFKTGAFELESSQIEMTKEQEKRESEVDDSSAAKGKPKLRLV